MCALSVYEVAERQVGGGDTPPEPGEVCPELAASLRTVLEGLTERRRSRGLRHRLPALLGTVVVCVACGVRGPAPVAELAAGFPDELRAALGWRRHPVTGEYVVASAATFNRLDEHVDVVEFEAAMSGWAVARALAHPPEPAPPPEPVPSPEPAPPAELVEAAEPARRRRWSRADGLRETREDGRVRLAPTHPFVDQAVRVEASFRAAQQAVAVDGKESRGAKRGGMGKVHLLGAVVHALRMVIAQERVENKTTEVKHLASLLEPLPLRNVVITADAMQTNIANTRFLRRVRLAHYLLPVLGNQPLLYALLNTLPWRTTPVTAATQEYSHGRLETRTVRHLPMPAGHGMVDAARAVLVERYVTEWRDGAWRTRAEAVLYITSLADDEATPADLLAHIRGHWTVEHTHWLRDVIWREDASLLRAGDKPQLWAAVTNLVINLFRLLGVTRFTRETRRNAQDPRRALPLLAT